MSDNLTWFPQLSSPPPATLAVLASPVLLFGAGGEPHADGSAPSAAHLFFPALTSMRWADPHTPAYQITNFMPDPRDRAELSRLRVTPIRSSACLTAAPKARRLLESSSYACPMVARSAQNLAGSGIVGVVRFFYGDRF